MRRFIYHDLCGIPHGPVDVQTLREMLASGDLQPTSEVSEDGTGQWILLSSVIVSDSAIRFSSSPNSGPDCRRAQSVMSRYRDAYVVAKITISIGTCIKIVGLFLTFAVFCISVLIASAPFADKGTVVIAGAMCAVAVGVVFLIAGTLVTAQGQILQASLDQAVNGSPFLTDEQRARTMSLHKSSLK